MPKNVGGSQNGSTTPDDHVCWERPEDMDYRREVQTSTSIVFRDSSAYSKKLSKGAETLFAFARDPNRRISYSKRNPFIESYYNSTGCVDEYMWGATWLFLATGNYSYLSLATDKGLPANSRAFDMIPDLSVLSWDNKLPAAMLLLTRIRVFLNPGYPYEDMLSSYHHITQLTVCSYLKKYEVE